MDCIGPIIVFLVVVGQIYTQVKKAQEQQRRRALQDALPPQPRTPHPPEPLEVEVDEEADVPVFEEPPPLRREVIPVVRAPAPPKAPRPPTVRLPDVVPNRPRIRLDHRRLRDAVILTEILGPPVGLR